MGYRNVRKQASRGMFQTCEIAACQTETLAMFGWRTLLMGKDNFELFLKDSLSGRTHVVRQLINGQDN